jgi:hypothetical protein
LKVELKVKKLVVHLESMKGPMGERLDILWVDPTAMIVAGCLAMWMANSLVALWDMRLAEMTAP